MSPLLSLFGPPWLTSVRLPGAEGAPVCPPDPVIVTVALLGLASVVPEAAEREMVNDFDPENAFASLMGIETVFADPSLAAHCRVPEVAV